MPEYVLAVLRQWMGRRCRRRVLVRSQGRERSMPNRWWGETCPKRHLRRQRDFKSCRNFRTAATLLAEPFDLALIAAVGFGAIAAFFAILTAE
jgi:hypothetical protein